MNPPSVLKNIIWNYIGRAYSILSIYIFTPFYIRYLGIEAFGIISFYGILLLITALADAGLSSTFTREAARTTDRKNLLTLLCSVEVPLLLLTGLISALPFLLSEQIARTWLTETVAIETKTIALSIKIMALMVPAQAMITLYSSGLMGLQQQVIANKLQAVYVTIRSGLVIPVIILCPRLELFFIWQLLCMIVYLCILRIIVARKMGFGSFATARPSLGVLRSVAGFSMGAFAIAIITNFNNQLDKIFVSATFPVSEFGYYGAASAITQIANAAVAPIVAAIFPVMVELVNRNDHVNKSLVIEKSSSAVAYIASLATFFLVFFAADVLDIWLGYDVPDRVVTVVQLQVLGWLFFALQLIPTYLSLAHGKTKPVIFAAIGLLVVAVPLLFWLSAIYGIVGAAAPWLVANVVSFIILCVLVMPRYYSGDLWRWLLKFTLLPAAIALAFASAASVTVSIIGLGSIAGCATGAAFGLVAIALLGYWAKNNEKMPTHV